LENKLAEKIGVWVQNGTANVGQINLSDELSRQESRNRQAILTKVRKFWIKDVLENSLNEKVITLQVEERTDAVANPWNLMLLTKSKRKLNEEAISSDTSPLSIFDEIGLGEILLIMGEPGSGKTITLLQLTRDLIARAEKDEKAPIPIVLNLSSWMPSDTASITNGDGIENWLVEELNKKYFIIKKIGKAWVEKQELCLLLDGLDEVNPKYRSNCVNALNIFQKERGTKMVVCSRRKDYELLARKNRLHFQKGISLKSLNQEQVRDYLDSLNIDLTVLRTLIEEDSVIQELSTSPLMLNILILTYYGVSVDDLPKANMIAEGRKQVFNNYIDRMFETSRLVAYSQIQEAKYGYSKYQSKRWLSWLAQRMMTENLSVFLIEDMQPTWLQTKAERIAYSVLIFLIFGLLGVITFAFLGEIYESYLDVLPFALSLAQMGVIGGLGWGMIGLSSNPLRKIELVEKLRWSYTATLATIIGIALPLSILGVIFPQVISDWDKKLDLMLLLFPILSKGMFIVSELDETETPNQGIWDSARNAAKFALIGGFINWLVYLLWAMNRGIHEFEGLSSLLLWLLLLIGVISLSILRSLEFGLESIIRHFSLRVVLYFKGFIPYDYSQFLNNVAIEHLFLFKVGGGYTFIHRALMEHFAEIQETQESVQ
jgi:DNA polymerase III delta prime subunit